jgi:RNA polymerase sigma factor (sigma-70 family)
MKEGDGHDMAPEQAVGCGWQTMSPAVPETRLMSLFLEERPRLRRIAAGMGMDSSDAEDVLQDVSVQVLGYEGVFDEDGGMMRWLIRTTVNRCLTEHRRRFRHRASQILERHPDAAEHLVGGSDVTDRVGLTEELELVRRSLLELDPSQLSLVALRYFCKLNSAEIAGIMEWNASTVRGRLREVRLILAGKLLQRGVEP